MTDFAPQLVIELDGGSHHEPSRSARDAFVDQAFAAAQVPVLHVPVAVSYNTQELAAQITSQLPASFL